MPDGRNWPLVWGGAALMLLDFLFQSCMDAAKSERVSRPTRIICIAFVSLVFLIAIASLFLPVSIFIRLDFPTFERPMKAYSGISVFGHISALGLLVLNSAVFIIIVISVLFRYSFFFSLILIFLCQFAQFQPPHRLFIKLVVQFRQSYRQFCYSVHIARTAV